MAQSVSVLFNGERRTIAVHTNLVVEDPQTYADYLLRLGLPSSEIDRRRERWAAAPDASIRTGWLNRYEDSDPT